MLLRLVALPLEPGDDFWRYQWEGKIQQAGFNPYVAGTGRSRLGKRSGGIPVLVQNQSPRFPRDLPAGR